MKKLSQINEGLWTSSLKRSKGEEIRKEDSYSNISKIKPVDMGCSVYWADVDLTIYGKEQFDAVNELDDEVYPLIKKYGWRIPTNKDIHELYSNIEFKSDNKNSIIVKSLITDNSIIFEKKGYYRGSAHIQDYNHIYYFGWIDDDINSKIVKYCFCISSLEFDYTPPGYKAWDSVIQNIDDKLNIRLVKDK